MSGNKIGSQKGKLALIGKLGEAGYRKHMSDIGKRGAEISNRRFKDDGMWDEVSKKSGPPIAKYIDETLLNDIRPPKLFNPTQPKPWYKRIFK